MPVPAVAEEAGEAAAEAAVEAGAEAPAAVFVSAWAVSMS